MYKQRGIRGIKQSISIRIKHVKASSGIQTIGSALILNDVLKALAGQCFFIFSELPGVNSYLENVLHIVDYKYPRGPDDHPQIAGYRTFALAAKELIKIKAKNILQTVNDKKYSNDT